jgi:hypothetical protein
MTELSSPWKCLPATINCFRRIKIDGRHQRTQQVLLPNPIDEVEEYRQRGQAILRALLSPPASVAAEPSRNNDSKTKLASSSSLKRSAATSSAAAPMTEDAAMRRQTQSHGQNGGNNRALCSRSERPEYEVDWAAVIKTANDLYEEEQQRLRRISTGSTSHNNPRIKNLKKTKRALERRRQYDEAGSFSINMLTYRTVDDTQPAALPPNKVERERNHQIHDDHYYHNQDCVSSSSFQSSQSTTSVASSASKIVGSMTMPIFEEESEYEYEC